MKNFEKYKTTKQRLDAFGKFCNPVVWNCTKVCKLSEANKLGGVDTMKCFSNWLDLEAEEEKPMPCPFCGSECFVNTNSEGHEVRCEKRYCYIGKTFESKSDAIAAHNNVCKAVAAYDESEVK